MRKGRERIVESTQAFETYRERVINRMDGDSTRFEDWYEAIQFQVVDVGMQPMRAFHEGGVPRFADSEELGDEEIVACMIELENDIVLPYLSPALRAGMAPSVDAKYRIIKVLEKTMPRATPYWLGTHLFPNLDDPVELFRGFSRNMRRLEGLLGFVCPPPPFVLPCILIK